MITVYGIPNCNTIKKARIWLEQNNIEYNFHDYKKKGISAEKIQVWFNRFSWEKLVNKAGTTWKALPEEEKVLVKDERSAIELMVVKTSVIKRPVIEDETGNVIVIGFSEREYEEIFL